MDILVKNQPVYMYPFIHLLPDGSLFVMVSKEAQLFDWQHNQVVRTLPNLPGMTRTYPSTGASILLPLSSKNNWSPEIMICGGGQYQDISSPTDPTCGRIQPLASKPTWAMEAMPEGRVMVEGCPLPDGTFLFLNGARSGAEGFGVAKDPALDALLYNPTQRSGSRFTVAGRSSIPRLYHSVALLLPDATVLVAGSNPNEQPVLVADQNDPTRAYATEFRLEVYTPPYLQGDKAHRRPTQVQVSSTVLDANGSTFEVSFTAPKQAMKLSVVLYTGGFVTHSIHMGHRVLVLDTQGFVAGAGGPQRLKVTMPLAAAVAPPGSYWLFVVCDGVPSVGEAVLVA